MKGTIVALVAASMLAACERSSAPTIDVIVAPHLAPNQGGIAIAVILGGAPIVEQGFGPADFDRRTPVTPTTVFDLASLSKQFTGMAILILAERGALSLHDDARKYLPELPLFDATRPIRIADLSQHVSGLPEFPSGTVIPTEADILDWLAALPELEFPTGARWEYRNLNDFLLARVVERASGMKLRAFLEQEIFMPAGMRDAQVLDAQDGAIRGRADGFCFGRACRADDGRTGPAGVFASLEDLIAWDRALAEGTVVPTSALMRVLAASRGYALGWRFGARGGRRLMEHDGDSIGTRTYLVRYLDQPLTIIILSNQTRLDVEKLERALAAYALDAND